MKSSILLLLLFISIGNISIAQEIKQEIDTSTSNQKELVFLRVEQSATFKGGDLNTFRNRLSTQLIYPSEALEMNQQGISIIQFTINYDGFIEDVTILKSSGFISLDQEALRVIQSSPKWEPARQGGSIVKQQFVIPIQFKLATDDEVKEKKKKR